MGATSQPMSSSRSIALLLLAPAAAALSHSRVALSSPRLSSPVASAALSHSRAALSSPRLSSPVASAALSHSRAALSSPRLSSPVASAAQQPQKVVSLTPASAVAFARGEMQLVSVPCDADSDGCLAFCDAEECAVVAPSGVVQRLKVGGYFALWFLLSVGYSITNKRVTNALPCPWSVATATVVVGSLFVNLLWLTGLRRRPRLSAATYRALIPIGTFHAIGHIAGTVGTAAGSVSFAQVVKAAGPVYACVLSAAVLKQAVSLRVWLSLAPIIAGVGLATLKELSFAWAALLGAVASDLALALRNVLSKQSMGALSTSDGDKLAPADMFGLLTCISAAVSVPAALLVEGRALPALWASAAAGYPAGSLGLAGQVAATGLYFYGYSEVAMKALNNVHPVTHAIGNTMRRVVIMLVCMVAFRTPMTPLGACGSALAIGGSYLYATVKQQEKAAEVKAAQAAADADRVSENLEAWSSQPSPSSAEAEATARKLKEALPLEVSPVEAAEAEAE